MSKPLTKYVFLVLLILSFADLFQFKTFSENRISSQDQYEELKTLEAMPVNLAGQQIFLTERQGKILATYRLSLSLSETCNFYKEKMPEFGWSLEKEEETPITLPESKVKCTSCVESRYARYFPGMPVDKIQPIIDNLTMKSLTLTFKQNGGLCLIKLYQAYHKSGYTIDSTLKEINDTIIRVNCDLE